MNSKSVLTKAEVERQAYYGRTYANIKKQRCVRSQLNFLEADKDRAITCWEYGWKEIASKLSRETIYRLEGSPNRVTLTHLPCHACTAAEVERKL